LNEGATKGVYSWWRYRRDRMKKIGILCPTAKEVHPYLSTRESLINAVNLQVKLCMDKIG
jgi:hypothetical protein